MKHIKPWESGRPLQRIAGKIEKARKKAKEAYLICDHFLTFQGEGSYCGVEALFIRFSKCNLSCSFCDEPKHRDPKSVILENHAAESLAARLFAEYPKFFSSERQKVIVITGGEPTLYDINTFIKELRASAKNTKFCVESNGFLPMNAIECDLYTFSPKESFEKLLTADDWIFEFFYKGNKKIDIKLLFDNSNKKKLEAELEFLASYLERGEEIATRFCKDTQKWRAYQQENMSLWLSPINDQHQLDSINNKEIFVFLKEYLPQTQLKYIPIRVNAQMHKVWGIQ